MPAMGDQMPGEKGQRPIAHRLMPRISRLGPLALCAGATRAAATGWLPAPISTIVTAPLSIPLGSASGLITPVTIPGTSASRTKGAIRLVRCQSPGQRGHQHPDHGKRPERIGHLRTERTADGCADSEHQQHQQRARDEGLDDPAGHCLSSFSSASISAMSCSVSSSRSARCATSGVSLPPKSRSISLRDSPAT